MTTRAARLSENGKVIFICLLFPILWPVLPTILACMGIEKIRRRAEKRAAIADVSDGG